MEVEGYCTKYALSTGIRKLTVRCTGDYGYAGHLQLKIGRDFFQTKEAAIADARKRARKKIASMKRQILKLAILVDLPKWDER